MNLRIRKKLCVISSKQCYELSTCTAATNLIAKKNPSSIDEVPPEILKEIFKCCDLPTRCKLRRFVELFLIEPDLVKSERNLFDLVRGQEFLRSIGSDSEMVQVGRPFSERLISSS
jgi:hypothetical protein